MITSRVTYGQYWCACLSLVVCGSVIAQIPEPAARVATSGQSGAEVLALEQQIEDAVVRGDVSFVSGVLSNDLVFVHGDGWTKGGKPLAEDDRAAFLKRVADKEYLVHDLDSVRVEMHSDIAITYGRYVSLFVPPNRNPATQERLNSIWFERVYTKRNGRWQFLSLRTVHGPTVSPAGIDPSSRAQ